MKLKLVLKSKLLTSLIAVAIVAASVGTACGSKAPPLDALGDTSPAASSGASSSSGAAPATGTKAVTITDPILKMTAYTLTIPSDWVFDGAVGQGTPCVPLPFPIWRMSSPDGLTGFKALPVLAWAYWDKPKTPAQNAAVQGCMDYKSDMPATDVLKYMFGVLQVEFVKWEPVPWLANSKKNTAAQNTAAMTSTIDIAIATVRYHINSILIEEQVKAVTGCYNLHGGTFDGKHYCTATVSREWAPSGKWNAATFTPIDHSFQMNQQWVQRWGAVMIQKIKDMYAANGKILQAQMNSANAQLAAQANSFQQAQDMRQKQHDDFDAVLKRGTDMSMKQATASANANHQAAGDWADYSLDQQKRLDPNTGKITKDSSAYSYTWVNEQGKRIQTNNVNDNPNGNGTGNWTLQENIH
nr:hypothetical protein [Candidatus Acidoferrales bacterium]